MWCSPAGRCARANPQPSPKIRRPARAVSHRYAAALRDGKSLYARRARASGQSAAPAYPGAARRHLFGYTRRSAAALTTWGQLGLGGTWADSPIHACAPEADSGTGQYFREAVLSGDSYAAIIKPLPRLTDSVVRAVAADPLALGVTTLISASPVFARSPSQNLHDRSLRANRRKLCGLRYPLTRQVYLCFNPPAAGAPDMRIVAFAKFLLGARGQQVATENDFFRSRRRVCSRVSRALSVTADTGAHFHVVGARSRDAVDSTGEFMLGSPDNENSRGTDEARKRV